MGVEEDVERVSLEVTDPYFEDPSEEDMHTTNTSKHLLCFRHGRHSEHIQSTFFIIKAICLIIVKRAQIWPLIICKKCFLSIKF